MERHTILFLAVLSCTSCSPNHQSDTHMHSKVIAQAQELMAGKYMILDKLGAGDEGVVYLVQDRLGKEFAAKYIFDPEAKSFTYLSNFKNTVQTLETLKGQPYMMQLQEIIGDRILVLERVKGVALEKYFQVDATKQDVGEITRQYMHALSDMANHHQLLIGDPSPPNSIVLKGNTPRLKFIDGGNYLDVPKEIGHLNRDTQHARQFFEPKIIKDSKGKKIKVTPELAFTISISKIVHATSTLLTKYDPHMHYDDFKELNFGHNVDFSGFSTRQEHTVRLLDGGLKESIKALRTTPIRDTQSLVQAMKKYGAIVSRLKERTETCLTNFEKCRK